MSIGNLSSPTTSSVPSEQDPVLLARINALKALLNEERRKRYKIENTYYKEKLNRLEPLPVSIMISLNNVICEWSLQCNLFAV
jgi:hypothetical protein